MKVVVFLLALACTSCVGLRHSVQVGRADIGDDWEPIDNLLTVGYLASGVVEGGGLTYEAGIQYGGDSETSWTNHVTVDGWELWAGPRYEWHHGEIRPYLTGGMSALHSEAVSLSGISGRTDSDTTVGLYLGGGLDWQVGRSLYLGMGVRRTFGHEPTISGYSADAELTQVFLRLGWAR